MIPDDRISGTEHWLRAGFQSIATSIRDAVEGS